jgi:hypothetical protein
MFFFSLILFFEAGVFLEHAFAKLIEVAFECVAQLYRDGCKDRTALERLLRRKPARIPRNSLCAEFAG